MSRESDRQLGVFVSGLLLGALIGASAGLLTAPENGNRTRRRLGRAAVRVRDRSGNRWGDLFDELRERTDDAIEGARKRMEER
jgi:gas vesicle protein